MPVKAVGNGVAVDVGTGVLVAVADGVSVGNVVGVLAPAPQAVAWNAVLFDSLDSAMLFVGSTTARFRMVVQPGAVETTIVMVAPPFGPILPPVQPTCCCGVPNASNVTETLQMKPLSPAAV